MSGGAFDFVYFRISEFARELDEMLDRQGEKTEYIEYYKIEPEIESYLRKTAELARMVSKLAKEAEWYFSGDTGPENYIKYVKEILKEYSLE